MVWYGVAWYGMVWFCVVWYSDGNGALLESARLESSGHKLFGRSDRNCDARVMGWLWGGVVWYFVVWWWYGVVW